MSTVTIDHIFGNPEYQTNLQQHLDQVWINVPWEEIERIWEESKHETIMLRHPDPAIRKLVVGCGNRPLVQCSHHVGYNQEYTHVDAITLDPNILLNPTIVGFFPSATVIFEAGRFDEIDYDESHFSFLLFDETTPQGMELERQESYMEDQRLITQKFRHVLDESQQH